MNKILLIISREYMTRVRKKSFLIMTLLTPILFGGLMIVPVWLAMRSGEEKKIEVLDESGLFTGKFTDTQSLKFLYVNGEVEEAKQRFLSSDHNGLLIIPKIDLENPAGFIFYSQESASIDLVFRLENTLNKVIENERLEISGIDKAIIDGLRAHVKVKTLNITEEGEKGSSAGLNTAIGFGGAILIYFFIFLYGVQVMRGVIEEKTNRIIEVMVSSVKPFQLMMGKIIGLAAVGLTQFLIWVILTVTISTVLSSTFGLDRFSNTNVKETLMDAKDPAQVMEMNEMMNAIAAVNVPAMLAIFLFYFIFGYLLYSAFLAAVGAAVDNETDSQQFMLPITIPLILSFVMAQVIIREPHGEMAWWLSMIPLTSPVIMMIRMPFEVPITDLLLSMTLLVLGFLGATWVAGRVYRIGILMYGKKPSWKELAKWMVMRG